MVDDPAARAMLGYLLVRGGTHIVAYMRALEKLTGADLAKLFPVPDISNAKFPEARVLEERGLGHTMFRFSPNDYRSLDQIWNGPHPETGKPLIMDDGIPAGFPPPDLDEEPQLTSPLGVDAAFLKDAAARLFRQ